MIDFDEVQFKSLMDEVASMREVGNCWIFPKTLNVLL